MNEVKFILGDFGEGKQYKDETKEQTVTGTVSYLSPEIYQAHLKKT